MSARTMNSFSHLLMPRRRLLIATATFAVGGLLAGCSPGGSTSQGQSGGQASTASGSSSAPTIVKMTDQMTFDPKEITIKVGSTVEWQNTSTQPHTSTDDASKAQNKADAALPSGADSWDSGLINPGQNFSHTFTVAGDYTYFCIPHESTGMVGKITVQ